MGCGINFYKQVYIIIIIIIMIIIMIPFIGTATRLSVMNESLGLRALSSLNITPRTAKPSELSNAVLMLPYFLLKCTR